MTKSQELKEKIIKEQLANLSIDPLGSYVNAEDLSKRAYNSYEDYYYNPLSAIEIDPNDILSEQDCQEICQAMIKDIREHIDEWSIEQEGTLTIIRHKLGKKHYKNGFDEEEWIEIEQVINNNQQKNSTKQKAKVSKNNKSMIKWKEIHPDFTEELQKEWEERGFNYQQTKFWIEDGLTIEDYDFAHYLKQKSFNASELSANQLEKLRRKYNQQKSLTKSERKDENIRDWKNISSEFTKELGNEWESKGFNYEECKDWIDIGLTVNDAEYAYWLRDIKKVDSEWVHNYGNDEELRKQYQEYSISRWRSKKFTDKEIEAWKKVGLRPQDGGYAAWMRDISKITPEEYVNYLGESNDDKLLREQWQIFLEERKIENKEASNKNWKAIHPSFTTELQAEWEQKEFTYEEVREWVENGFGPKYNELFSFSKEKGITPKQARFMAEWGKKGFTGEQNIEWINAGLEPGEANYAQWLRDVKKLEPNSYLNCENKQKLWEEYIVDSWFSVESHIRSLIKEECKECHQNTALKVGDWVWCQPCNAKHFQEEFKNWTSGNEEIDEFIQKSQSEATHMGKLVQWIPYEEFASVEFLAEGGFGKVYKAKWVDKPIVGWDVENKSWKRDEVFNGMFALKSLNNSQNITADFLREITSHKLVDEGFVIGFYGISQDPETKNYLMVMEYLEKGNLRQYLQNNYKKLSLEMKLKQIHTLSQGLNHIHKKGLIHKDFHPGNVLVSIEPDKTNNLNFFSYFFITDLGLCRPANEKDQGKVYGVLPYVAPEVLREGKYTQASDVYSFGMIIYELMTGLQPYHNISNDSLTIKICRGLRPNLDEVLLPQLLKDLIRQCWDADPEKRPKIDELENILLIRFVELSTKRTDSEFYWQCQPIKEKEIEDHCKPLSELYQQIMGQTKEINSYEQWQNEVPKLFLEFCKQKKYDRNSREAKEEFNKLLHPKVKDQVNLQVSHSKLIDTKQIAQLFQDSEVQALEKELKKIEQEINQPLTDELKKLVSEFIQTRKITIKDKENEEAEDKVWDLEDKLKEKGISKEKVNEIIRYCERFIKAEQQLEQEQLQANIEITTNKK